jgi:formylglycine-generating enzyme required for sulfatase activity
VKVGDANNAAQVSADPNQNGFGAVATDFWIGKYEVTIGQYTEFLNAVAKTNDRGLFDSTMDTNPLSRGIEQSGTAGAFVYTVVGPSGTNPVGAQSPANRPITRVSWFDSARFANWMANGKPTGAAGSTTTDNGAYNLGTATSGTAPALNTTNPNTGEAPTFSLPTENQWYKAAYYSPVKNGPGAPGYFLYGTQNDTAPGNGGTSAATALANKDLANQANYLFIPNLLSVNVKEVLDVLN